MGFTFYVTFPPGSDLENKILRIRTLGKTFAIKKMRVLFKENWSNVYTAEEFAEKFPNDKRELAGTIDYF